ncbi:putative reverse transcriptase domain-containing protein [Tanacetum coccineum]|uniref:Reverse transcriptase domain-containing protein n=1 Tax=Tanacetum coccineum TaxID=301880 RepID=A0ABQ5AK95_9ASTR
MPFNQAIRRIHHRIWRILTNHITTSDSKPFLNDKESRSSNKDLVQPFENPEQVLRSSRKLFKTRSLANLSSLEFNLINPKDQFEEEETKTMGEPTIEEYMTKTRERHGNASSFPYVTYWSRNKYCPPARTAKKMEEINNFQQDPDETLYQAWEQFNELLLRCPQHYLTYMQEVILFYKGLDVPTRQILDSKGAIPSMKAADAKKAIQDMANHSQKWHNGTFIRCRSTETSDGLAAIQAQLNNLGREIKKVNEIVKEDNIKQQLQDSTKGTMETLDLKTSLILGRPFLSTAHAKIDVFKRKITLRVGNDKVVFKSEKPTSNIIKRVYMLSLRERMELDLEARLIREALILNRSLDPLYGDYIELNDLNEPLELRRN